MPYFMRNKIKCNSHFHVHNVGPEQSHAHLSLCGLWLLLPDDSFEAMSLSCCDTHWKAHEAYVYYWVCRDKVCHP